MKVGDLVNVKYTSNVKFGVIFKIHREKGHVTSYGVLWDNGTVTPRAVESVLRVIREGR